ncbi:MAG: hypothetical protein ABIS86_02065 [Streptosporangiaceae bacterium]
MNLDVNDLRVVFRESTQGSHDDPGLLTELDRGIRRDARRRYAVAATVAVTLAGLLALPLMPPGIAGTPVPAAHPGDGTAAQQDHGPRLDLRKGPEPVIGTVPVITGESEHVLPMDAYWPTDNYRSRITWAINWSARQCLRRYGLDLPKAASAVPRTQIPGLALVRSYGVADPARAAAYGYGFAPAPGDDGASMDPPESRQYRDMNKTEYSVFFGRVTAYDGLPVPPGGCLQEAQRSLGDTPALSWPEVDALSQRALKYTLADSRVNAVTLQWHDCMRRAGFLYASPQRASTDPAWQHTLTTRETDTAKADVTCKQQTNLLGLSLTVQAAYERQLIGRNSTVLTPLKAQLAGLKTKVENLIALHQP